jgi:hypothetical protein
MRQALKGLALVRKEDGRLVADALIENLLG